MLYHPAGRYMLFAYLRRVRRSWFAVGFLAGLAVAFVLGH